LKEHKKLNLVVFDPFGLEKYEPKYARQKIGPRAEGPKNMLRLRAL